MEKKSRLAQERGELIASNAKIMDGGESEKKINNSLIYEKINQANHEIDNISNNLEASSYNSSEYKSLSNSLNDKIAFRNELVRKILPNVDDETLRVMGVERDGAGNIILYHATPVKFLDSILKNGLKPSRETGNRSWRLGDETGGEMDKVYLGTKESIQKISKQIDPKSSVYILEVHVPEANLFPDEDSGYDNWIDSLKQNFKTCSYKGSISPNNLSVVGSVSLGISNAEIGKIRNNNPNLSSEDIVKLCGDYLKEKKIKEVAKFGDFGSLIPKDGLRINRYDN
ncbi:MAG: hypothetical protein ACP5OG_01395 [Candidatus Nanoarchaeia archaeon]